MSTNDPNRDEGAPMTRLFGGFKKCDSFATSMQHAYDTYGPRNRSQVHDANNQASETQKATITPSETASEQSKINNSNLEQSGELQTKLDSQVLVTERVYSSSEASSNRPWPQSQSSPLHRPSASSLSSPPSQPSLRTQSSPASHSSPRSYPLPESRPSSPYQPSPAPEPMSEEQQTSPLEQLLPTTEPTPTEQQPPTAASAPSSDAHAEPLEAPAGEVSNTYEAANTLEGEQPGHNNTTDVTQEMPGSGNQRRLKGKKGWKKHEITWSMGRFNPR